MWQKGGQHLAHRFSELNPDKQLWDFAGLSPEEGLDAQSQRDHFARNLSRLLDMPPVTFTDWSDGFEFLGSKIKPNDIVLFDEISWMALADPTFIPKLKAWRDRQTTCQTLIFGGSVSTWIEENILNSTAFFGRVNLTITLEPLSIPEASELLSASGFQGSPYEIYKLLGILGGIPWYLEQVTNGLSADEIIRQMCFEKEAMLALEFGRIFHDLFGAKGTTYRNILDCLKNGMRTLVQVRKEMNFSHSGTLSKLMENLITAGFVKKQNLWSFKTGSLLKQSLYRICDPYMRFYLKLIEPQLHKIEEGTLQDFSVSQLPGFESHLGLQIEQLLLQNRSLVIKALGLSAVDIVSDGPYRQNKNSTQSGCQIDYLIQTRTNNLFVCEFKFKRRELHSEITQETQNKIKALKITKGFAAIPVLFHIGGVSASVETDGYFYRVIDITDFLE